ncbi:MAG: right-handed parallel beta-helix repeat-containing protein [Anaerolineae bacterium]
MNKTNCSTWGLPLRLVILLALLAAIMPVRPVRAAGTTYYVSSSGGSDSNNGLSESTPFKTIAKVNSLNLQPGDRVLFKCGDTWRAEQLVIKWAGTADAPITFGSYPAGCANKPILSGSLPITGWTVHSGNIYRADVPESTFPLGINQLFRNGQRLTLGRWPNLGTANGGYSFVDGHTAGSNQIVDNELPSGINWTGAIVHIKNIRWSMLERQVTSSGGTTLTLNKGLSCLISSWGDCIGWGYFINNHLATLDRDGEWYYDAGTRRVYLYSDSGTPANIEGSVVFTTDPDPNRIRDGGIMLSDGSETAYIIIDNFEIKNWFNHGIGTPGGMNRDIYHHITVRNVTIRGVNSAGVRLSSWLERPSDGRKGLRGGHHMTFTNNVIDGANHFGITGYFAESTFEDNVIRNIALIQNLGKSGMGCGQTSDECTENGDGIRIRTYDPLDSGYGNTLRYNRLERIGYNGVDVFGHDTTLEKNFITQSCYSKADCGGVRTFGTNNLSATEVYNVRLLNNIIVDIPGNVDGCHASRAAFGMGLYVDHYSRDVEARGNTVISTTITGINYQRSTGTIVGNTVYNASYGTEYAAHISLGGDETRATVTNNILFGLNSKAWTIYSRSLSNWVSSDYNYLFHPYVNNHIAYGPSWTRYTFSGWKTFSGLEAHSKTNWFTQPQGELSRGKIFYNASKTTIVINLGDRQYLDLDQNTVIGSLTLAPFTSKILVDNGPAPLTLLSINPSFFDVDEAADFTLTADGAGFTANSVVRWNGSDRPTTFVSSTRLTATIRAADVSTVGSFPVTVYDPAPSPGGTETPPRMFYVVKEIFRVYLPLVFKSGS